MRPSGALGDQGDDGFVPAPAPIGPDEQREIERQQLGAQSMDVVAMLAAGKRMTNRTHAFEQHKQKFVDAFLTGGRVDAYPAPADDVEDENRGIDYRGGTMRVVLIEEVTQAFRRTAPPPGLDPTAVAHELLHSAHGDDFRRLKDMSVSEISVGLVLAHLETFGYGLDARLAASIARRATLVLMNRRLCQPDEKRGKRQRRAVSLAQYDVQAERAAIMEFDGGLSRDDAEEAAREGSESCP